MIKDVVQYILREPLKHSWQLQGFGMLRLYLPNGYRLAIWNRSYSVPGVTDIHTHPWSFTSFVVARVLEQFRYSEIGMAKVPLGAIPTHTKIWMQTGPGGGLSDKREDTMLVRGQREIYREGEAYSQLADEIHSSHPQDGTVTLVKRIPTDHPDNAYTVVPFSEDWVSTEPRSATNDEVEYITSHSLTRWF